jgi:WD40 domain-containing protein
MVAVALIAIQMIQSAEPLPAGAVARLGDTRFRADGPVRQLRFSTDGRVIHGWVSADDGVLRPMDWDTDSGMRIEPRDAGEPPDQPENAVPAVRLERNRVLTAGPGNVGIVWDADARKELARLGGHVGTVRAVAASPDGRRLATGDAEGLVRLWDAERYLPLPGPRGHTGAVRAVQFSADGKRAMTTGDDQTARVWDLTTGRELRAFATNAAIDLNAAGTGAIVRTGETTTIRDVVTGLEMIPPDGANRSSAVLPARYEARSVPGESPCGRIRAQLRGDAFIELREASTDEVRRVLHGERKTLRVLGFTPDGSRLLTASADHTILVWDVRLQATPLPDAIKCETKAVKLWEMMCMGSANEAYVAMARLAAEPPAAVRMARFRLTPARSSDQETAAKRLADSRAVELLEALGTEESRVFLKELAEGDRSTWLRREARRAVERQSQ